MSNAPQLDHRARFADRATVYHRYRSKFPPELLDVLRERCGLQAHSVIADVGAGTGMLAELFLANGNRTFAVEPNAEMLALCRRLCEPYPNLTCVQASAEATTLPDASVDIVAVGRALHWFDLPAAKREFQRVLVPGGWLAVMGNIWERETGDFAKEYDSAVLKHARDLSTAKDRYTIFEPARLQDFLALAKMEAVTLSRTRKVTLEELIGRTVSISYAPLPDQPGYPAMCDELTAIFYRHQQNSTVEVAEDWSVCCGQIA
ncbi:MAG: class I SAM-dependent methyltransferase [Acidobacteriaceae bacterium]